MDIHSVRQELRSRTIYDIPLRVTYYARVSSESAEQLNSLSNHGQMMLRALHANDVVSSGHK